jgi:hypothetical protein
MSMSDIEPAMQTHAYVLDAWSPNASLSVFATGQLRERWEVDFSFIGIAEIRENL